MGKDKSTTNRNDRYPGDDSIDKDILKTSEEDEKKKYTQTKPEAEVTLVFKENRKKDLHIGKDVYTFYGASKMIVPRSVIEHPDFESQKEEFLIKED